jgi:hypothetical protein
MYQSLSELMDFSNYTKPQFVDLCNALYHLLEQRAAQAPQVTILGPPAPYVPPMYPTWNAGTAAPLPQGGVTICNDTTESTQQDRFGVR